MGVLRADPERGSLVAAAAVGLALTVALLSSRFEEEWGAGVHLVYSAAAAGLVIALAVSRPRGVGRPEGWQSILFIASFVLTLFALTSLADVFGTDEALDSAGTVVWVGLLLAGLMLFFARAYDSGIATLLSAVTTLVVVIAFVEWVFDPDGLGTFRWILLFAALGFAAYSLAGPEEDHHGVGDMNTAGLAVLAIAGTYGLERFELIFDDSGGVEAGTGWELVLLVGGLGLIAYSLLKAKAGPGYLGVANLIAFVILGGAVGDDGPSLVGWPLIVLLVTAGLLVVALRRDTSPPVPPAPSTGAPPTTASEDTTQIQPDP
jgi:hypothetical protein